MFFISVVSGVKSFLEVSVLLVVVLCSSTLSLKMEPYRIFSWKTWREEITWEIQA